MRCALALCVISALACGRSQSSSGPAPVADAAPQAQSSALVAPASAASRAATASRDPSNAGDCPPGNALTRAGEALLFGAIADASSGATVSIGELKSTGSIPDMGRVLEGAREPYRTCYRSALAAQALGAFAAGRDGGSLAESLELSIAVGRDGNVTRVDVVANDRVAGDLEACMVNATKTLRFGRPATGKPETIRVPLQLAPAS